MVACLSEGTAMTTAAKKNDNVSLTAIMVVIALMFGLGSAASKGGLNFSSGGGGSPTTNGRGQSSADDPCKGQGKDHVVKRWMSPNGLIRMRCGDSGIGYRHHRANGRSWDRQVKDCIGRTLREGTVERRDGMDTYRYNYSGKSAAKVVVIGETGDLVSAHLRHGRWSDCAKGGSR
jgi:hypothetical protein